MRGAAYIHKIFLVVALGLILVRGGSVAEVWAEDEVEQLQREIDELSHLRALSEDATKPLEVELSKIRTRINTALYQLKQADIRTREIEKDIERREDDLVEAHQFLAIRARNFYKFSRKFSPLLALLSSNSASSLTRELSYQAAATDQDRSTIVSITRDILQLEDDKESLAQRKMQLEAMHVELNKNAAFFEGEIRGAKQYQAELSKKISELTKRQEEILAQKQGTFQTTVGDVPAADDPASRPDYNPGFSPAFAAFSFGAPHYKGMSQYGALGRAKTGQNAEQILKAYYGDVRIETKDMPGSINTSVGSMPFEDQYLKGIAEMPSSWADEGGMEALKAQAIAARTYALSYVGWRMSNPTAGGSICTSENCQVYSSSKAVSGAAAKWHQAVAETRGKVVVSNKTNEIFATWYASTSGGYQESYTSLGHTTPSLWDTKNGRAGWTSDAYEKIAGSPWFYKGWYRSRSGDACGRSHPWLTQAEMADILNAWVVLVKHGESDDRVVPLGSCWGGNPYSIGELKSRADQLSGGYSSVTGVSVTYSDAGVTAQVKFFTDRGEVSISGSEFKKAFNLRAPGRIAIKSGLYNIEKK